MELKKISEKVEKLNENEFLIKIIGFNNEDSHLDIIRPQAANRTIKNNFNNIKHVIEHWHDFMGIVGAPKEFEAKEDGLWVVPNINRSVPNGEYTYNQYNFFAANGMNIDHSIGYDVIKTQKNDDLTAKAVEKFGDYYQYYKDKVGRDIVELKLYEYSPVFRGSNSEANQLFIKSDFDLQEFIRVSLTEEITPQKLDNLKSALLHAEGTQKVDPPTTPQVIPSIKINEFAKILTTIKY